MSTKALQGPYVFLSYPRSEMVVAKRLEQDLQASGLQVWRDESDIRPGSSDWEEAIRDAISHAYAVVLIAAPEVIKSLYIKDELDLAKRYHSNRIYPVWMKGTEWSDCVPLGFIHTQYIDMRGGQYTAGLHTLISALTKAKGQSFSSQQSAVASPQGVLSRRTVVVGLAGLMVVGAAGGGLLWLTHPPVHTQDNWRWCRKCYGLYFGGASSPGPCPAGGEHDDSGSGNYTLTQNDLSRGGQQLWFWCYKCNGLYFGGAGSPGPCPAGGEHSEAGSGNYVLQQGDSSGQRNWFWCYKCNGLFYGGLSTLGRCPAGGQHSNAGSGNYVLPVA